MPIFAFVPSGRVADVSLYPKPTKRYVRSSEKFSVKAYEHPASTFHANTVGVAILGDDRGGTLWMADSQAETGAGCFVVQTVKPRQRRGVSKWQCLRNICQIFVEFF